MIDYNDQNYKVQTLSQVPKPPLATRPSHVQSKQNYQSEEQQYQEYQSRIDQLSSVEEKVHQDHVGEYKSELVKILFEQTGQEVAKKNDQSDEHLEIKKVDLNQLGYNIHLLREGANEEKVFYGCKLIDSKKVFTVRT